MARILPIDFEFAQIAAQRGDCATAAALAKKGAKKLRTGKYGHAVIQKAEIVIDTIAMDCQNVLRGSRLLKL